MSVPEEIVEASRDRPFWRWEARPQLVGAVNAIGLGLAITFASK
jgi:hypothetical protein